MIVEIIGGWLSGSLALLADAGHMLVDTCALALAFLAERLARRPSDGRRTYGYRRVQVLAAFVNAAFLLLIVAWIVYEAAQRLREPHAVAAPLMLVVAVAGALVNLLGARLLHAGDPHDLNQRAAYLHVLSDLAGSLAAVVAAVVILTTGWLRIDPLLSLLVALLITRGAWDLLRRSTHILLEGAPDHVDIEALRQHLATRIADVTNVHHVHAWSLSTHEVLLTLHVRTTPAADGTRVLADIKQALATQFGIHHSTVQLESDACADTVDVDCVHTHS